MNTLAAWRAEGQDRDGPEVDLQGRATEAADERQGRDAVVPHVSPVRRAAPHGVRRWRCQRVRSVVVPVYADTDRLAYEQMQTGEPCRGCGQELLPSGEPPSWVGKGSMFLTDEERAGRDAA